jgi:NAD(P)-dependent dehydrogenase (short-subunit alcohol dehydrogenase family)
MENRKIALVTGATEGIGKATAKGLLEKGFTVIIHGRNAQKLADTAQELKKLTGSEAVETLQADLSSLREVKAMADLVRSKYECLNVLINNAGTMMSERSLSKDGHEMMLATNYLAVVVLTEQLLPLLRSTPHARIINLSSVSYKTAKPDFNDLQCVKNYDMMRQYGNTKLFDLYYTLDLAERLKNTGITVNAVHPGGVRTHLARDFSGVLKYAFAVMMPLFFISTEKGASTSVYLASDGALKDITGKYFVKNKPETLKPIGHDAENRKQLWEKTWQLVSSYLQ